MSTAIWIDCGTKGCRGRTSLGLYDALRRVAEREPLTCNGPACRSTGSLRLKFPFALWVGPQNCTVVRAYVPAVDRDCRWTASDGSEVEFVPFLVVLDFDAATSSASRCTWLPYWHLHTKAGRTVKKYGQWAPLMNAELFEDLLRQARGDGVLANWSVLRPAPQV